MAGIIRNQTDAEKDLTPITSDGDSSGFIPIMGPGSSGDAKDVFITEAKKHEKIANKAGRPFAMQVALEEFRDYYENQAKVSMRKNGYVKRDEIKSMKVDWERYSDLKNFDKIGEHDRNDENLTSRYKLPVYLKTKVYKFKDYRYLYKVMEDGAEALVRAQKAERAEKA